METATDPFHLIRPTFTLPLLTREQWTRRPDGSPSDLRRAMDIVDDLIQISFEPSYEDNDRNLGGLNEMMRKQLSDALLYGGFINVKGDGIESARALKGIANAVLGANEAWEIAHMITPHLVPIDPDMSDDERIAQARCFFRHKIGGILRQMK